MLIFIDIVLLNFHLLSIQYFFSSAHLSGIDSGYQNYPTSKYNFFSQSRSQSREVGVLPTCRPKCRTEFQFNRSSSSDFIKKKQTYTVYAFQNSLTTT